MLNVAPEVTLRSAFVFVITNAASISGFRSNRYRFHYQIVDSGGNVVHSGYTDTRRNARRYCQRFIRRREGNRWKG